MDLTAFEQSLSATAPPRGISPLLTALWHERKGDWTRAHEIAQDIDTRDAAWVHAYLHRREGDLPNAAYWYRHAGKPVETGSMEEEWRAIVAELG
ncbi:MAG: hypothetical protein FJW14_16030 [Acidimicrobiia bacterium]|nr:hypothetical protein [Acidimicrobiia bacterium]